MWLCHDQCKFVNFSRDCLRTTPIGGLAYAEILYYLLWLMSVSVTFWRRVRHCVYDIIARFLTSASEKPVSFFHMILIYYGIPFSSFSFSLLLWFCRCYLFDWTHPRTYSACDLYLTGLIYLCFLCLTLILFPILLFNTRDFNCLYSFLFFFFREKWS